MISNPLSKKQIAVDFGTANCVILIKGKGIVLNEPTVVAVSELEKRVVAVGEEAKLMLGKVPEGLIAKRPLKNGGIANYRLSEALLKKFFSQALGKVRIIKPDVIVSVPAGLTSVEERAIVKAFNSVGAGKIFLFPEPIAASIGAAMPIHEASGNLIVNLGGGTAEIAVISLNGIVTYCSHRGTGDAINDAIKLTLKNKCNLSIGDLTCEQIKIEIGSVLKSSRSKKMEVKGRNIKTGLPDTVVITSEDILIPVRSVVDEIVSKLKSVIEKTPPELVADIFDRGMVLSGGTSLLDGIDEFITKSIGIPAFVVDEPLTCVARGLSIALDNIANFKRSVKKF